MCVLSVSPNSLWFKFPTSCVLWQKVREQWVIAYLHLVSCISGGPCCVLKFLTLQTQEQSYQLATSLLNKTLKFLLPCVTVEQRWGTASLKKKKDFPDPIVVCVIPVLSAFNWGFSGGQRLRNYPYGSADEECKKQRMRRGRKCRLCSCFIR